MGSPIKVDSLSGLGAVVTEVETALQRGGMMERETFEQLQQQINELQVCCPNHKGVLEARVRWYEVALASFELRVVMKIEDGADFDFKWPFPWPLESVTWLVADTSTLDHFLRRHYLKDSFPRLFRRLVELYNRIVCSAKPGPLKDTFQKEVNDLEQRLLEGRF